MYKIDKADHEKKEKRPNYPAQKLKTESITIDLEVVKG